MNSMKPIEPHPMSSHTDSNPAHCNNHHELVVENLSVSYHKTPAIANIDMRTRCGNTVALIGPNGAGKSTLLKAIAGLLSTDTGHVRWRETKVRNWSREIAYLPQREQVDWNFPITVRGVVEMGRYPQVGWWRAFSKKDSAVVNQALEHMALNDLQHRQISQLSGGQQQRVFLARALAQEAHVLLLDEPFTGLDKPASEQLAALLRSLAREGRLVIASHHDLNTVSGLYDEALILNLTAIAFGPVSSTFTTANLKQAYGPHFGKTIPGLTEDVNEPLSTDKTHLIS